MGMYTELDFNAELRSDTPPDVLDLLAAMIGTAALPDETPNHPLFKSARWRHMLQCDSYYFAAPARSALVCDPANFTVLTVRCNLKNYDGEIEKFVDWIMPYVNAAPGEMLGYSRYEEADEPTVIRKAAR